MSEHEEGSERRGDGASPLREQVPPVTRLNRNALFLIMGLAAITVLVAVTSLNSSSHVTSGGTADSGVARMPVVAQRPVLPPLRVVAPAEGANAVSTPSPVPPEIAFEQRSRRERTATGAREPAQSRRADNTNADAGYQRALVRNPIIEERGQTVGDSSGARSGIAAPSDSAVERALLAPLLRPPGSTGVAPYGGQGSAVGGEGLGDVSAVSQRAAREHREFLSEARGGVAAGISSVEPAPSMYELTAGTAIDAALVTDLNSDLPGTVGAQVTRDVYDSRTETSVLVPKGSRLIGRYDDRILPGQSRVLVAWTRLLFPDGRSVGLPGVAATDGRGATGAPGSVNSHLARVFEDAAVLSVLSAGAELSQPNGGSASAFTAPSVGQTIGAAAGSQLASLGTEMVRQGLTVKPTIVVPAGAPVAVLLADDLVFPGAYQDTRWSMR